ncbi:Gfo/Idh/MocA family protein [Silicimonas sp. MF1-12-2]|uniref:Gfo/Idh/MocA family protein n=1 Tax=Silicimonas sp. MF1-12-2 TaxID=3384793 RepID=UPI0039B38687
MRLLILGTGAMANTHATAFGGIDGVRLAGCVDIDRTRAEAFAARHGIDLVFDTLTDALSSGGFDAIANVTPDALHFRTSMEAMAAGLHVFCEKPLAVTHGDARHMTEAAAQAGLINGVNLTYRNVAALQRAREIIGQGEIGEVRHFEASYLQSWLTQPAWGDWATEEKWLWRLSSKHGSTGVLGDVGVHIFDFATYAIGSDIRTITAHLKTFPKAPGDRIGEYDLDANDSMLMTAELGSGASGVIHASRFATGHLNDLHLQVFGTHGGLEITNRGDLGSIRICSGAERETATWRDLPLSPVVTNYQRFAEAVRTGRPMKPDFATATRLQAVIDAAFEAHRVIPRTEIAS